MQMENHQKAQQSRLPMNHLFSIPMFFSPFIITQFALFRAESLSLNGPEGICRPLPTHCLSLKQTNDKF